MEYEYKCETCGGWFNPLLVNHDSEWWKGYKHTRFCSVECIGKHELEEHMKPVYKPDEERCKKFEKEPPVDCNDEESTPSDFALRVLRLVALKKIGATDAKIMSMLMESPKPSQTVIANRTNVSKQFISKKVVKLKLFLLGS